ncbi:MAG: hypothetical protein O2819_08700 [Planctomycetota bacterium]|nr:hypothetical protein [Planctomycetota bacterium]
MQATAAVIAAPSMSSTVNFTMIRIIMTLSQVQVGKVHLQPWTIVQSDNAKTIFSFSDSDDFLDQLTP